MKTSILMLLAAVLLVTSHNVPAWDYEAYLLEANPYLAETYYYDPYTPDMPQDSYVTPHVWGGGYTESYPAGTITVSPDGLGGFSIHRSGFIPRSQW